MQFSQDRDLSRLAALSCFAAVALGAMGAHGEVHDALVASGNLASWEAGVRYHLPHSMFLYLSALFIKRSDKAAKLGWNLLFFGMLLFSGSIYLLAYYQWRWLGPVTPLGGLLLMAGWLSLSLARWQPTAAPSIEPSER
jgi:uncharacterized membrane protein YgdD (TMEM256/DUF423 family)